jgi:hypothetical protein
VLPAVLQPSDAYLALQACPTVKAAPAMNTGPQLSASSGAVESGAKAAAVVLGETHVISSLLVERLLRRFQDQYLSRWMFCLMVECGSRGLFFIGRWLYPAPATPCP